MSGIKTGDVFGKDEQPANDLLAGENEAGHEKAQANPPTVEEIAQLHGFVDHFYDWLREQEGVSEVSNHDGTILSFILGGFGDVSVQFTPTGHTGL